MTEDSAGPKTTVRRPRNWDKCVSAAYLRILGASQDRAAEEVGCSPRSIRSWEKSEWWPDARQEARDRWLQGNDQTCMLTLTNAMREGNAKVAMWWADRRVPELLPPAVQAKIEHTGAGGAPITTEIIFVKPDGSVGDGSGDG